MDQKKLYLLLDWYNCLAPITLVRLGEDSHYYTPPFEAPHVCTGLMFNAKGTLEITWEGQGSTLVTPKNFHQILTKKDRNFSYRPFLYQAFVFVADPEDQYWLSPGPLLPSGQKQVGSFFYKFSDGGVTYDFRPTAVA